MAIREAVRQEAAAAILALSGQLGRVAAYITESRMLFPGPTEDQGPGQPNAPGAHRQTTPVPGATPSPGN